MFFSSETRRPNLSNNSLFQTQSSSESEHDGVHATPLSPVDPATNPPNLNNIEPSLQTPSKPNLNIRELCLQPPINSGPPSLTSTTQYLNDEYSADSIFNDSVPPLPPLIFPPMNESLVLLPQTPPTASIGNCTPPHSLQISPSSSVTSVCHMVTSTPKIK